MNTRQAIDNGWLTQATIENEEERIFVKSVSSFGSIDNWKDATQAEKDEWEAEHPVEEMAENGNLDENLADFRLAEPIQLSALQAK